MTEHPSPAIDFARLAVWGLLLYGMWLFWKFVLTGLRGLLP